MSPELDKKLCEKYPKICVNRHKLPTESLFCFGFEISNGWVRLIINLFDFIQNRIDNNPHLNIPQFEVDQVKEKMSTLRIYYNGGDEVIKGAVQFAEYLSGDICEGCGSQEKVGRIMEGRYQTKCYKCAEKGDNLGKWKENEEGV